MNIRLGLQSRKNAEMFGQETFDKYVTLNRFHPVRCPFLCKNVKTSRSNWAAEKTRWVTIS